RRLLSGASTEGSTTMTQQLEDGTAHVLDLAGRQRMLNEKLQKEILAKSLGGEGDPEATIDLLRETAMALSHGGEAVLVPGPQPVRVLLGPPPTPAIGGKLAEQARAI